MKYFYVLEVFMMGQNKTIYLIAVFDKGDNTQEQTGDS